MSAISEVIEKVVQRIDLEEDEIASVFDNMMQGLLTPSQISAFLIALRMKGETISEITGAAKAMIEKSVKVNAEYNNVVDLCGTGGDKTGTFNVSTTVSFIVAGAGVPVAKHGNRSVSSPVGSADVLEELGININLDPVDAEKCLKETGIVFLFAPVYHPAMKNVAIPRKEIGVRTIFNLLGPILNPARVKHQLIGVYSEYLIEPIAKVLRNLGSQHAMIVHGADSLDEFSVTGKSSVAELKEGVVKKYQVDPVELGFKKRSLDQLKGGMSKSENAQILLSILKGEEREAKYDVCILNAAAALLTTDVANDFAEAIEIARESVDSGRALEKLNGLIKFSINSQD